MSSLARPLNEAFSAAESPTAAVYTRDPDCEGVLRYALNDLPRDRTLFRGEGLRGALADVSVRGSPRLLVVDITEESDPVARVRELSDMCEPATRIVAIGAENDIRVYRALLNAGAAEYFFKPLVSMVMAGAIRSLLQGQGAAGGAAQVGRVVHIVGVRGGCGATTLMVSLGMTLSESPPRPVVMLDLDLQSGDAALALNATPNAALREALTRADRVDDLLLERGLINISNRLDLLASLEPLEVTPAFDEEAVIALLDKIGRRYRYVVLDVPAHAAAGLSRVLHMPSTLVLVSDGRLASAREVARWRSWMGANASDRALVHVLNMQGAPGSLPLTEYAKAAGHKPDVVIPYLKEIAESTLMGLTSRPAGALAKGLQPLAAMLGAETSGAKRPFLKRIFG